MVYILRCIYFQNHDIVKFSESDKKAISKHFNELKTEMAIDTKQLSEQNKIKTLLATKSILVRKLQKIQEENRNLELCINEERKNLNTIRADVEAIQEEICQLNALEAKANDEKSV